MSIHSRILIDGTKLLRLFRKIKSDPKRTWLSADLRKTLLLSTQIIRRYLELLQSLGLIEEVQCYYISRGYNNRRVTSGWKLK